MHRLNQHIEVSLLRFFIYILLGYVPFYLVVRFSSNSHYLTIVFQDIVVAVVSFLLLIKYSFDKKKSLSVSKVDALVLFFILYNIVIVGIDFIQGGFGVTLKNIHNIITGMFIYFIVKSVIERRHINTLCNLYIGLSLVVSILLIYEWYCTNVTGTMRGFAWLEHYGEYADVSVFTSSAGTGLNIARVAGILGHVHATATFIGGGILLLYARIVKKGISKFTSILQYIFVVVCVIALLLSGARTAQLSFLMASLACLYFFSKGGLIRIRASQLLVSVFIFVIIWFIFTWITTEHMRSYEILYGRLQTSWILEEFIETLNKLVVLILNNPFALIIGAGFAGQHKAACFHPVMTDDIYIMQFFSQIGLIGMYLFLFIIIAFLREILHIVKRHRGSEEDRKLLIVVFGIFLSFLFTMAHSGAILRYGIYYWQFAFLSIASILIRSIKDDCYSESHYCPVKN